MTRAFKKAILLVGTSCLQDLSGSSEVNTQANGGVCDVLLEIRREGDTRRIQGNYFLFDWCCEGRDKVHKHQCLWKP